MAPSSVIFGDVASLKSGEFDIDGNSTLSFQLRFDLETDDLDTTVSLRLVDAIQRRSKHLFQVTDFGKGGQWTKYYVCIPSGRYSLLFEATIGDSARITVELDRIKLLKGQELGTSGTHSDQLLLLHPDTGSSPRVKVSTAPETYICPPQAGKCDFAVFEPLWHLLYLSENSTSVPCASRIIIH